MLEQALYQLDPITDNPKFEGFAFARDNSIRGKIIGGQSRIEWDFNSNNVKTKGREWTVEPLAPYWTPQKVIGRVRPMNDYPCVNLIIPAFSKRAVECLCDFLEPNGELLPLETSIGEYYAYNITKVADIIDQEQSVFRWMSDKRSLEYIYDITRYVCIPDKMTGLSIFNIVEMAGRAYVTQQFVDRVRSNKLQGFNFIKLWPIQDGISVEDEKRKQLQANEMVQTVKGSVPIKGNTVVLMLPTAQAKPSKLENERLNEIMDELDTILGSPNTMADKDYFGSLEGEDTLKGERRLFLSCPDANLLVDKLRPWLKSLTWQSGTIKVLKRFGEYVDLNCREEYVDL